MRHFTNTDDETLGTLFCGDNGRTLLQTHDEETRMWNSSETETCFDDGCEMTMMEMMDLFLNESTRCTKEEFLRRGWGEERWEQGLSQRLTLGENGKTHWTR